jgi:metallophosphoesterase (TIGR00282 family)
MKLLFIGDTFGKAGRRATSFFLPQIKKEYAPDLVVMNAENLSGGVATNEKSILEMEESGVDFFTGGNHSFQDLKIYDSQRSNIIRPANLEDDAPGVGHRIREINGKKYGFINLLGRVFIKLPVLCPFRCTENILNKWSSEELDGIVIDFHAETTSEKAAFFHHFRNRVSAIIGTHTHVPTADAKIWDGGTFFLTDIGMTGPVESIIGLQVESGVMNFSFSDRQKKR